MRPQSLPFFLFLSLFFHAVNGSSQCNASFNSTATSVCSGNMVNFINTSTGSTNYAWKINEMQFSTATNSSYLFPIVGSFTVELVVTDGMGCEDSSSTVITVNQTPTVDINVSASTLWASDSVHVTFNTSGMVGGAFFFWDFCDGNNASSNSPFFYQWDTPGTGYCVCVELDNNNGCSDADCAINIVVNDDLGNAELSQDQSIVYPNPSAGQFTIRPGISNTDAVVRITDQVGRTVRSYSSVPGELVVEDGNLAPGLYYVHVLQDQQRVVLPLIIE